MANREELLIIRAARAGKAPAQLALGKRYLFGGGGLPQSHSTALHWLQKAAENNQPDAWLLIELGYWFGLTRAEALLIDVQEADHGHCLEIDIREQHPRSRRRLILILTSEQRQAVDYAARVFDTVDGTPIGSEGNYRQRIYRFRSLMSSRRDHNRTKV